MCGSFLLIYFLKIEFFIEIDFCIPELIQGFSLNLSLYFLTFL